MCCLPAYRYAELFEYHYLIDRACQEPDSVKRMMLVAVWQLSCYNSQVGGGLETQQWWWNVKH